MPVPVSSACSCFGPRACTLLAVRAVPQSLPLTLTLSPTFGPVRVPRPLQETRVSAVTATVTAEPAEDLTALLPFLTVTEKDEAETEASVPAQVEVAAIAAGGRRAWWSCVPVVVEPPCRVVRQGERRAGAGDGEREETVL